MIWDYSKWGGAAWSGSASVWLHPLQDGLGSVRSMVTPTLDVHNTADYAPFGQLERGVLPSPFGFTGGRRRHSAPYTDDSDQRYLRGR